MNLYASSQAFTNSAGAHELASGLDQLVVVDRREEMVVEAAPLPYTTTDLLEDATLSFGWTGQKVMELAQELFEMGWITYPRTDSTRLSPEARAALRDAIFAVYGPDALSPLVGRRKGSPIDSTLFNVRTSHPGRGNHSPTDIEDAHEAIRPTDPARMPESLEAEPEKVQLYGLIWGRSLASQMKSALYKLVTIQMEPV